MTSLDSPDRSGTPHTHRQRFDGDDPYLVCDCGARWDARSGRPLNTLAVVAPDTGAGTLPDLWADLDAASKSPGPTMMITKAQYGALQDAARSRPALNVDRLAKALHPDGKSPTVDCCMDSTTRAVHGVEEGERLHRLYHHRGAVALAAEYTRLSMEDQRMTDAGAEDFWRGKCLACAHPEHEMTCPQPVPGGNPSDGPAYCPCADRIEWMEREIVRLRSRAAADPVEPRHALARIAAWSSHHKDEARTQLRRTMALIHDEAMRAVPGALDAAASPRPSGPEERPDA